MRCPRRLAAIPYGAGSLLLLITWALSRSAAGPPRPALGPVAALRFVRRPAPAAPLRAALTLAVWPTRVPVGTPVHVSASPGWTRYTVWVYGPHGPWRRAAASFTPHHPGPWFVWLVATAPQAGPPQAVGPVAVTVTPAGSPAATVTLAGRIRAHQILLPVVLRQTLAARGSPAVSLTGLAIVDTGAAAPAALDGQALQAVGGQPDGQTLAVLGFGGTAASALYDGITIAPAAAPAAPWIRHASQVPGGVGRLDVALTGSARAPYVADLGLPILESGRFTIHGTHWTWTYRPAL